MSTGMERPRLSIKRKMSDMVAVVAVVVGFLLLGGEMIGGGGINWGRWWSWWRWGRCRGKWIAVGEVALELLWSFV